MFKGTATQPGFKKIVFGRTQTGKILNCLDAQKAAKAAKNMADRRFKRLEGDVQVR